MEFRDSLAYKVLAKFQDNKSQSYKDTAIELDDLFVELNFSNQVHIKKVSVKEQLCELQGRQNQMIAERNFINSAVARYNKLKAQKAIERKQNK